MHLKSKFIGKLFVFLELCPHGNLLQYLKKCTEDLPNSLETDVATHVKLASLDRVLTTQRQTISNKELLKWSIQIADAMSYLAEKKVWVYLPSGNKPSVPFQEYYLCLVPQ